MATQTLATLAPEDIKVVVSTDTFTHIISGYSEDAMVSIARNSPTFEIFVSADNQPTRVYKSNTSATVTLTLNQTSVSNDVLSQLYINDKNSRNSTGLFQIQILDMSGRSRYTSGQAFIAVVPDSAFSNSIQTRDWQIFCNDMETIIGGNALIGDDDANTLTTLGATVEAKWRSN